MAHSVESRSRSARWLGAVRLAGATALIGPIGIVLHELGHFFAARAMGFDGARLNVASVSGGPALGADAGLTVATAAAAGPFVTLALVALAWGPLRRPAPPDWALALAATAPLRFLIGAVWLGFAIWFALTGGTPGTPNFDEYNVAGGLGVPVWPLVLGELVLLALVWVRIVRHGLRGRRWIGLAALIAGAFIGVTAWMAVIGPLIFGR